ncbi:MAG: hypothetical protein ACYTG4_12095 [Planctomycetota bacterium]|jgi:hypothetical protein
MSNIVAVSDGKRTVVGGDRLMAVAGQGGREIYTSDRPKIWRDETTGFVLGAVHSARLKLVLRQEGLPGKPASMSTRDWAVGPLARFMRELKEVEKGIQDETMLLIVDGPEILAMAAGYDQAIAGMEPHGGLSYCCIGAGRMYSYGALFVAAQKDVPVDDAARIALEASATYSGLVAPPFDYIETPLVQAPAPGVPGSR